MAIAPLLLLALLAQSGGECRSFIDRARAAYESRNFSAAVAEFDRALIACPEPRLVLLPLAQAQLMAQQLDASIKSLTRLLVLDPRNPEALKLHGDVLYLLGREDEAKGALEAAIKIDPRHQPSQYALGRIYYQQSRAQEAAALFQSLIDQDPKNYRAHDNLALCYAALQRDNDAVRHFMKALDLVHKDHPSYDVVYANFADYFLDRSRFNEAFQLASEAATRNPNSARNFFLTGKALMKLEKPELSVRWFKQAAELDPKYSEPRYWLAQAYRKLGKSEEATRELEIFRELGKVPKVKR